MNLFLGIISLLADIIAIVTFIISGQISQFWSTPWIAMLIGIGLLMIIALFFLDKSGDKSKNSFLPLVSGAYAILSCLGILFALYILDSGLMTLGAFFGIGVLIIFPAVMAFIVSEVSNRIANHIISYCYASTGLISIIGLMYRYTQMQNLGFSWNIVGEVLILIMIFCGFFAFNDI